MFNENAVRKKLAEKEGLTVQCAFLDLPDNDDIHYMGGILKDNEIICMCCGATFDVEEIIELAKEAKVDYPPIIIFDDWVSLTEEVCGWENIDEMVEYAKHIGLM